MDMQKKFLSLYSYHNDFEFVAGTHLQGHIIKISFKLMICLLCRGKVFKDI